MKLLETIAGLGLAVMCGTGALGIAIALASVLS